MTASLSGMSLDDSGGQLGQDWTKHQVEFCGPASFISRGKVVPYMLLRRKNYLKALTVCLIVLAGSPALAAFIEIDNFNNLMLGPVDEQNEWQAADQSSEVSLDPVDAGNQVLSVITASTHLYHPAIIPEGEGRMLFLRFRYEEQLSVSFGMTSTLNPSQFGQFRSELSLTSTNDILRINDGGTYTDLISLEPGHWYNCWMFVDNGDDVTSLWLHDRPDEPATEADQLAIEGRTSFPFRSPTLSPLVNFFIKTGGGMGVAGPLLLDDIYLEDTEGINLSCPTAPISAVGSAPGRLCLWGASPNPFNPQTTIAFDLPSEQAVSLRVYDVAGRLVDTLLNDDLGQAGRNDIVWKGRDKAGRMVPAGVYHYRLEAGGYVETKRMTLLK